MEKIIAVVVMIAIVIGLIATAVLPYVSSMNDAATEGQNQLNTFTGTMAGDSMTGAAVVGELKSYIAKFTAANEPLVSCTVIGTSANADESVVFDASNVTSINTNVAKISNAATYQKTVTGSYPSGKAKTIQYKIINLG